MAGGLLHLPARRREDSSTSRHVQVWRRGAAVARSALEKGIFDWGIVGTVEHRWPGWDPHDSHGNTTETAWEGKVEHCMAHQGEKRVWVKFVASDEVRAKTEVRHVILPLF
jgi:hypothetical protein